MKNYFRHATKGWGWWDEKERACSPNHDERRRWRNAASEYVRTGLDQRHDPTHRTTKDAFDAVAAVLLRDFVAGVQYLPRLYYVHAWTVRLDLLSCSPSGTSLCVHIVDAVLDAEGPRHG